MHVSHGRWLTLVPMAAERNGRKTLTTVQGLPKKFDQKKILKFIKKKFGVLSYLGPVTPCSGTNGVYEACNGTIVNDSEMGEVIQLQGDQRKQISEWMMDKKEGLELDEKIIKVSTDEHNSSWSNRCSCKPGPRFLSRSGGRPV